MERDIYMGQVVVITGISTHTLTWSVTEPPREITPIVGNFNSHAHVERDGSYAKKDKAGTISTHTLTWSVTSSTGTEQRHSIFQLTRSRGA